MNKMTAQTKTHVYECLQQTWAHRLSGVHRGSLTQAASKQESHALFSPKQDGKHRLLCWFQTLNKLLLLCNKIYSRLALSTELDWSYGALLRKQEQWRKTKQISGTKMHPHPAWTEICSVQQNKEKETKQNKTKALISQLDCTTDQVHSTVQCIKELKSHQLKKVR